MPRYYKIHIAISNASLKIGYKNGTFFKLERLTGKLTDNQVRQIGYLIPPKEEQITQYQEHLKDKATYSLIEGKKTLYGEFNDAWFSFYEDFMSVEPRFNGVDGANLKKIIAYLTKITQDEREALDLWKVILTNWKHLDDFHKNNTDLKYINSKINVILNNVKRVNKTGAAVSADYLQRVMQDLQSD